MDKDVDVDVDVDADCDMDAAEGTDVTGKLSRPGKDCPVAAVLESER